METAALFDEQTSVVASCPGRVRIRVPKLYRSSHEKVRIEKLLSRHENIDTVLANPLTGKVLILFHFSVPAENILAAFGLPLPPPFTPAAERRAAAGKVASSRDLYPPWHMREAESALEFHGSSPQSGLSDEAAEGRLRQGRNVLPQLQARSSADILLGQFKSLPVLLLGASAMLSVLTGGIAEALAIATVLALNAGIGFATERRAESTIASLSELLDRMATVLRDGRLQDIEASRVVPGDILMLSPGVHVAADARLVQSNGITVNESVMTGESRFVAKMAAALAQDVPVAGRINMVYMGTVVTAGTGLAVVVGTGSRTEIGMVQSLMERTAQPKTPIQKQLDRLGNQLVTASVAMCAGVFAIGMLRGFGWLRMLKASTSLAIAAVPEGLPTVATTSLARSIRLMNRKQMLVRRLQAVETLGAIHTICLDKTGTLTMNRMSVVALRLDSANYDMADGALRSRREPLRADAAPSLSRLLQICVLCNDGEVKGNSGNSLTANGSATENALIELALAAGIPVGEMRERYPLWRADLRAEDRHYMKTVRAMPGTGRLLVAVKGSPAEVLALCDTFLCGDLAVSLTNERRADILRENQRLAERQLRVLGFAYAEAASPAADDAAGGLVWVGLAGLADPLRAGAEAVVAALHRAGIRTAMVTGDQSATARAIGQSLELNNGRSLHVLEFGSLAQIDPRALKTEVAQADIFARVSPERKLEIVRALQACGEVVAMTGDGINDGPALQASDVGIAMGLHGTELARSAADVVLEDDRLETVLEAIREGRTLTINIRKSLHFLVSSNMSEIMVVFGALATGAPTPLTPMQLLWVNLLGDVLPAIALASEPAEGEVMRQPPRDASRPLIGGAELRRYAREGMFLSSGVLAAYAGGLARHGPGARAGTIAFNALTLGQLLHALSCRSDRRGELLAGYAQSNNKLNLAIGVSIGLQLFANLMPGLRRLLGVAPMGAADLALMLAGAGAPLLLNEAAKKTQVPAAVPGSPSATGG